jgi:hypothetical protein
MEPGPRAAPGAHRLRPLNAPAPAQLRTERGLPAAVRLRAGWRPVERIDEVWRVDDGWWRPSPVRRTYFRVALEGGVEATLYRDEVEGTWWSQRY